MIARTIIARARKALLPVTSSTRPGPVPDRQRSGQPPSRSIYNAQHGTAAAPGGMDRPDRIHGTGTTQHAARRPRQRPDSSPGTVAQLSRLSDSKVCCPLNRTAKRRNHGGDYRGGSYTCAARVACDAQEWMLDV